MVVVMIFLYYFLKNYLFGGGGGISERFSHWMRHFNHVALILNASACTIYDIGPTRLSTTDVNQQGAHTMYAPFYFRFKVGDRVEPKSYSVRWP